MRYPIRHLRLRCLWLRPLRPRSRRVLVLLIPVLLLALGLYFRFRWLPTVKTLVVMELDNETSNLIDEAVAAYLAQEPLQYDDLVRLEYNRSGAVAAARVDLVQADRMKSAILRELEERIPDRIRQSVRIPLGNTLLPALLSGRGGSLPVRVLSLRSTNAELESSLAQAGINQTLHRLELRVEVELLLLTPAGFINRQVTSTVPIAQTILLGEVPNILLSPP